MTGRRGGLPSEHAVDDDEEEDVVNDTFPVGHHHSIGAAQVRLALRMESSCEIRTSDDMNQFEVAIAQ